MNFLMALAAQAATLAIIGLSAGAGFLLALAILPPLLKKPVIRIINYFFE